MADIEQKASELLVALIEYRLSANSTNRAGSQRLDQAQDALATALRSARPGFTSIQSTPRPLRRGPTLLPKEPR